jgi:glycosyltransferase involved in cell wall biosynthesis
VRLRLFIDGSIIKPQLGGIATYTRELIRALAERSDVTLCVATSAPEALALPTAVEVMDLPDSVRGFTRRAIWREWKVGKLVSQWSAHAVLSPTPELPLRRLRVPAIMVVHDVGALEAPELYGRLRWLRFAGGLPLACRSADHIVCVSRATLAALTARVPSCADYCTVIGEAPRVLPVMHRAARRPPYILTVGSLMAHKNVDTLVVAMGKPQLRGVELILVGPVGRRERELVAEWRRDSGQRIRHLGFVDTPQLAALYAGASVVALPSLHEGFGLPLLEAMQCGVPIVASSIPAHREVGGNAPLFVDDPYSASEWAGALGHVIEAPGVSGSMARRGLARARDTTWAAVADQIARLAVRLIENRRTGGLVASGPVTG